MWRPPARRNIDAMNATQTHSRGNVDEVAGDFWASRPQRPHRGRKFAGVAAGIGYRYGIDPTLVRVAFIVAAVFGGFGVFLYLVGWLLLPEEGDSASPVEALFGRGYSSTSSGKTIFLLILLFPTGGWALGGVRWTSGGSILLFALVAFVLYKLHATRGHERRPARMAPPAPSAGPASFSAQSTSDAAPSDGDVDADASADIDTPSGWDPLGAEPLAWDLPDAAAPAPVAPAQPPVRRARSKVGGAAVGLALLTAAAGTALGLVAGVPWFSAPHIIGLALAVLGAGLVISAFSGGSRGLVVLAVPLALAGVVLTSIPMQNWPSGGLGDLERSPATAADVLPKYERSAGNVKLDLSDVDSSRPVRTAAVVGAGNVKVEVPENADVTYTCHTGAGDVDCFDREADGHDWRNVNIHGHDLGEDGPGGPKITIDASARMGNVEIDRD